MPKTEARFGAYASYYNLLYRDKDYQSEVDYLEKLLGRFSSQSKSILNLGCGTGRHDLLFARAGYQMTGVDLSKDMIGIAQGHAAENTRFIQGDAREVRLKESFDAVMALFHVMSYQITNEDIAAVFETASSHLETDGLFIFDCWYGPGVLTDPPVTRVKRMENDDARITRLAESTQDANKNLVTVNYEIIVEEKKTSHFQSIKESHNMRYLFVPEMKLFGENAGFRMEHYETWMTGAAPSLDTWNVVFVMRKL